MTTQQQATQGLFRSPGEKRGDKDTQIHIQHIHTYKGPHNAR